MEWPEVGLKPYPSRTCGVHADRARPADGSRACSLLGPRVEVLSSWSGSGWSVREGSLMASLWRLSDKSRPCARGSDMAVKGQDGLHGEWACSHRAGRAGGRADGRTRTWEALCARKGKCGDTALASLCAASGYLKGSGPWFRPTHLGASQIRLRATSQLLLPLFPIASDPAPAPDVIAPSYLRRPRRELPIFRCSSPRE